MMMTFRVHIHIYIYFVQTREQPPTEQQQQKKEQPKRAPPIWVNYMDQELDSARGASMWVCAAFCVRETRSGFVLFLVGFCFPTRFRRANSPPPDIYWYICCGSHTHKHKNRGHRQSKPNTVRTCTDLTTHTHTHGPALSRAVEVYCAYGRVYGFYEPN